MEQLINVDTHYDPKVSKWLNRRKKCHAEDYVKPAVVFVCKRIKKAVIFKIRLFKASVCSSVAGGKAAVAVRAASHAQIRATDGPWNGNRFLTRAGQLSLSVAIHGNRKDASIMRSFSRESSDYRWKTASDEYLMRIRTIQRKHGWWKKATKNEVVSGWTREQFCRNSNYSIDDFS